MGGRGSGAGTLAASLPFEERTLPAMLDRGAELWPDRVLLRGRHGELTFAEVRALAAAAGGRLHAAGMGAGDRVAIVSADRTGVLEHWLGCGWLGAVAAPLNPGLDGRALAGALAGVTPRVLVCDADVVARAGLREHLPGSVEAIWVLAPEGGERMAGAAVDDPGGWTAPVQRVAALAREPAAQHGPRPADVWAVLHTSGTTGAPKRVLCPHGQFAWWGEVAARHLDIREGDVLHTSMPLFHGNALNSFVMALLAGATYSHAERFDAAEFWPHARERGATIAFLRSAWVQALLQRPAGEGDLAHGVRTVLAPNTAAEHAKAFAERFGADVVEGYGSTETTLLTCNRRGGRVRPGCLGWSTGAAQMAVLDEHDRPVPDGVPGELAIRPTEPFSIASGYDGAPEQTVESWRNLWFHTGDRVVRDADGCHHLLDRGADAIRRRGGDVSSVEVERALLAHPRVESCAVVGVPSDSAGDEEVMAFVVPASPAPTEPELIDHCAALLAPAALPRYVELVDALPETETRKVRKVALRARGVGEGTWDRERSR